MSNTGIYDGSTKIGVSPEDLSEVQATIQASLSGKVNITDIKNNLTSTDADKPLAAKQGKILNDNETALQASVNMYGDGENLAVKFSDEIGTTDIWEWLHNRVSTGNYTGMNVGDYIDADMPAGTVKGMINTTAVAAHTRRFRIVGFDLYTNTGPNDAIVPHHLTIDAGNSTDTVKWNPSDYTCGRNATSADDGSNEPWLCSNLYACLNGVNNANGTTSGGNCLNQGWLQYLTQVVPDAYIYNRRYFTGRKFPGYQDYTGYGLWLAKGKIFAPTEIEAYGCLVHSQTHLSINTSGTYGAYLIDYQNYGPSIQFPYYRSRGNKGLLWPGRFHRWLSSVAGGSTIYACYVNPHGVASRANASNADLYAPLCFHFI